MCTVVIINVRTTKPQPSQFLHTQSTLSIAAQEQVASKQYSISINTCTSIFIDKTMQYCIMLLHHYIDIDYCVISYYICYYIGWLEAEGFSLYTHMWYLQLDRPAPSCQWTPGPSLLWPGPHTYPPPQWCWLPQYPYWVGPFPTAKNKYNKCSKSIYPVHTQIILCTDESAVHIYSGTWGWTRLTLTLKAIQIARPANLLHKNPDSHFYRLQWHL